MEKTSDSLMLRLLLFCTKIWESVGYKVSDNTLSTNSTEASVISESKNREPQKTQATTFTNAYGTSTKAPGVRHQKKSINFIKIS